MAVSYLTEKLRPEDLLILSCSRVELDAPARLQLEGALSGEPDWGYILRQTMRQGIAPLLYEHLATIDSRVPREVLQFLAARTSQVTVRNRVQMDELNRLVTGLEGEGVPVIPFKGPMLADQVYGNAAFRTSGDLDILVRRDDIPLVKRHLLDEGYRSVRGLDAEQESHFIDTQLGYEFYHPTKETVVEVHWSFFYKVIAIDLSPDEVWKRHGMVPSSGGPVRALAPEDLLIYLCAHGTKHRWVKITWVADVAELVRRYPDLDWNIIRERARRLGCMRILQLGLHLAEELLSAPVPADLSQAASTSRAVRSMARQVCSQWMFHEPDAHAERELVTFLFHWKEREQLRDRLPLLVHQFGLWLKPSQRDRDFVELPETFSFLYYLVRPFRLLFDRSPEDSR